MPRPTAIYEATGAAKKELSKLISIEAHSGLKEFVIAYLTQIIQLDCNYMDRDQLNNALSNHVVPAKNNQSDKKEKSLSIANSMISRRIQELESLGCLRVRQEYRSIGEKKRKFTIHSLITISGLIEHLKNSADQSPAPQGRPKLNELTVYSDMLVEEGLIRLDADGEVTPYTEGAFSILESAARSRSDKENVIHCQYYLKKDDFLSITAATSTREGAGIMYSSDQRVIQALNGMLKQAHNEIQKDMFSSSPKNDVDEYPTRLIGDYCFFDIYALTREIGMVSNSKQNRDNVKKMIERLKDTTYTVDATNSQYWRERYMPDPKLNKAEYRYILEFYSGEDYYAVNGKNGIEHHIEDRVFVVKFHPLIINAMTTPKQAFISHDSLKVERLDIVHRLNNWVKPVVGVRPKRNLTENHHRYTLDIFHQRVRPASRLDNFESQFFHMVSRQNQPEIRSAHEQCVEFEFDQKGNIIPNGTFWLNGYYFKLEENEELAREIYRKTRTIKKRRNKIYPVLTIWRDKKDPIVGDDSDHNKALRRQLGELGYSESEDDEFETGDMFEEDDQQGSELATS